MKNQRVLCSLFISSVILCGPQMAYGETFTFEPDMQVALGRTWNPLEPFSRASLSSCFNSTVSEETPIASVEFSEDFIETLSELDAKSSIDISTSGSSSFGLSRVSAGVEYSQLRELFSSDNNVIYAVTGTRKYDAMQLEGAELNNFGRTKLDEANQQSDSEIFYNACGESIITSVTREANIGLVYIFRTSSAASRDLVRQAISAAVSTANVDADGSVDLLNEVRRLDASTTLELRVYQDGVRDSVPGVDAVVAKSPGDIVAVRSALRSAISSMAWANSQIESFTADEISDYFDISPTADWTYISRAYNNLDLLKQYSDRLVDRYISLDRIEQEANNNLVTFREGMRDKLRQDKADTLRSLEALVETAKSCFADPGELCTAAEPDIDYNLLAYVNVDYGSFLGWQAAVSGNGYDSGRERIVRNVTYWPRFSLRNRRLVREFQLIRNGSPELVANGNALDQLVENQVLSTRPMWERSFSQEEYCWRGRWGEDCTPWAADIRRHKNELKSMDNGSSYEYVIIDVEGNEHRAAMPKISATIF